MNVLISGVTVNTKSDINLLSTCYRSWGTKEKKRDICREICKFS